MFNRKQPVSLFFVPNKLSDSSKELFARNKESGLLGLLDEVIISYFDVYVLPNLNRMKKKLKPQLIVNILSQTSCDEDNFKIWLGKRFGNKNMDVKNLCIVLRRLIRGELNSMDPLPQALSKSNTIQPLSISQYNWLISQKISQLIQNYVVNDLCCDINLNDQWKTPQIPTLKASS